MNQRLRSILAPFASLKLTVGLLAAAMVLILAGTTVQSEMGIWDVQRIYFHSWFCLIEWKQLLPLWTWAQERVRGGIPFPGGYTLIVALLVNLLAAHTTRFKFTPKRSGILMIHAGLILLLVGEIVTSQLAVERNMTIDVGSSANFASDVRDFELAVTDTSPADHDREIVIPASRLVRGGIIKHEQLPFTLRIDEIFPNADLMGPMQAGNHKDARATAGAGTGLTVFPMQKFTGTEAQNVNQPAAYVSINSPDKQLGTYLVSTLPLMPGMSQVDQPQAIQVDGKTFLIHLRFKRAYTPYTITLEKFSHDRYEGTDVPKNFSSLVHLTDPSRGVDRQVLIWMNHPLRYAGETFYQSGFKTGDNGTILQVVRNPGWLIPYISCSLVGLGLLTHFGMHLLTFLKRRRMPAKNAKAQSAIDRPLRWPAAVITAICAIYIISALVPSRIDKAFDYKTFASLPVSYDGRTMPLDSLARNSLRILSGRSEVPDAKPAVSAIEWLGDVFAQPDRAEAARVFRIDLPELKSLLELDEKEKFFSADQIHPQIAKLQEQYEQASNVESRKRDLFQRKVVELADHILLFRKLAGMSSLLLSPPIDHADWRAFGEAMDDVNKNKAHDAGAEAILGMVTTLNNNQPQQFNAIAGGYRAALDSQLPQMTRKLDVEVAFNNAEPFVKCMALYVIVFVLAAISWLKWQGPLARAALWLLVLALVVHTLGLGTRIYLQGRPPVTNLYSSAVFIAWAVVLFCALMELIFRNGVACAAASAIAFPSLLIAHYLAADGDTMKMLQAVLDTNIWLATHVVVITLGYSATFLAGVLAIGWIVGELFGAMNSETGKTVSRMIYGVLCFAMLFSFVGTILGGIWADQSWGRFWGWDPKENGAVLIVLWNALILHARFGGLVRERGIAQLALFGNIVTAWSWFGTNMLGVGLHSYGFMDSALFWLGGWVLLNLGLITASAVKYALSLQPQNAALSVR